jgi:hypothetical protein
MYQFIKNSILIVFTLFLFAGCVQKPMNREQHLVIEKAVEDSMSRTYQGITREQAIAIAEQVLWYSEDDIKITEHHTDGFFATRKWMLYAVFAVLNGIDMWRIDVVEKEPNIVEVNVVSWLESASVGYSPYRLPTAIELHSGRPDRYYASPHLYNLFFARFDYFAGLRNTWEPCPSNLNKSTYIFMDGLENGDDPLCYMPDSHDPTKSRPSGAPPDPKPPVRG